jgi:hypothetical protein
MRLMSSSVGFQSLMIMDRFVRLIKIWLEVWTQELVLVRAVELDRKSSPLELPRRSAAEKRRRIAES